MEKGKLIEKGNHHQLMNNKDKYYSLIKKTSQNKLNALTTKLNNGSNNKEILYKPASIWIRV